MSRIGRLPITLTQGVTVSVAGTDVTIAGPKGELKVNIPEGVKVAVKDGVVNVTIKAPEKNNLQGLVRALIFNATNGVSVGWRKTLELNGTGYRANTTGRELNLALGFSHPVVVKSPPGITFEVVENKITVAGIDRGLVGEIAAQIRRLRPADPYKLKGFKYEGEKIVKKAGKTAKAGATTTTK